MNMASINKRGNTWQYTVSRYVDGEYKPIRKGGFRTKREATLEATEVENNLNKNHAMNFRNISLADYFKEWLELYKQNVGSNTLIRYLTTHKTIDEYFGSLDIKLITKKDYQKFLNEYGKTRVKSTVQKLNSHIRACVGEAVDEGIVPIDFTRNVTLTGTTTRKALEKTLNFDETEKLIDYLKMKTEQNIQLSKFTKDPVDTRHLLIHIGITTGMRFAELIALTPDSFNFNNNTVKIRYTWGYLKRMHEGFGETKNKEARTIVVPDKIMEMVKKTIPFIHENKNNLLFYTPVSKYKVHSNSGM